MDTIYRDETGEEVGPLKASAVITTDVDSETSMPARFNWLSALGLAFSITNSWAGYMSNFGQNLIYGGPRHVIFGLILAFFAQWIITTGLSELASAFPSSAGQYHYCYVLSPARTRRFAAYVVGWMTVVAWWITTCGGLALVTTVLQGIIQFWYPHFIAARWQTYLLYVFVSTLTFIPTIAAQGQISLIVQLTSIFSLLGFVGFFLTISVQHGTMQPPSHLIEPGLGSSGWSEGVAMILAASNAMYAFGATDAAIRVSEEVEEPEKHVPQVMCATMMIGMLTTLPLFLLMMFFMTDLDAVLKSSLPGMELMYQITGSRAITTFLFVWLGFIFAGSIPSKWVTNGRMAWAFARDNGFPNAKYFSHLDPVKRFPLRTTVAAFIFSWFYGLLYLVSNTALNSIITSAVLFLNISYAIPQGILLFRKGGRQNLPARYLDLGCLGPFMNLFSIAWVIILVVFLSLPPTIPMKVEDLNYTSLVLVIIVLLILLMWRVSGRRSFYGSDTEEHEIVVSGYHD